MGGTAERHNRIMCHTQVRIHQRQIEGHSQKLTGHMYCGMSCQFRYGRNASLFTLPLCSHGFCANI